MSGLRLIYAALAIWGAVHPTVHFVAFLEAEGWHIGPMIDAWQVNEATSGLTWDLTISAIALTVWVLAETTVRRNWLALVAIPATFGIGLSCGLPLYLFLRTRPVG